LHRRGKCQRRSNAMEELYAGSADAMCLVSNDGEFTRLAIRIRERGLPVIVFDGQSTPIALRSSCTEFHGLFGNSAGNVQSSLEDAEAIRKGSGGQSPPHSAAKSIIKDLCGNCSGWSAGPKTIQMSARYAQLGDKRLRSAIEVCAISRAGRPRYAEIE